MRVYQLDDWWYLGSPTSLMRCVERWTPRLDFFPQGLNATLKAIDTPGLTLYLPFFCADNVYRFHPGVRFVHSETVGDGTWNYTHFSNPAPESAATVFGAVMDAGLAQGMRFFEIDYLVDSFMHTHAFRQTPGAFETFLSGLSAAAVARGVPVQFCMGLPSDALSTLTLQAVTSFRASIDYGVPLPNDYGRENWQVGGPSLLLAALGLAPFKDNFWSTRTQPGIPDRVETNSALHCLLATMSGGAVAISDTPGYTDDDLVRRSVDTLGRVLKSSLPLTPIDMPVVGDGYIWTAHSTSTPPTQSLSPSSSLSATGLTTWHVLAIGVKVDGFELTAPDLWPRPTGALAWLEWPPRGSTDCRNGSAATDCVTIALSAADLRVSLGAGVTHHGTHPYHLLQVSEYFPMGVTMLGERSKWVGCSAVRFTSIAVGPHGVGVTGFAVAGGPHEVVEVVLLVPIKEGESLVETDMVGDGADVGRDGGRVMIKEINLGESGEVWVNVTAWAELHHVFQRSYT